jgi:hypothetical protein
VLATASPKASSPSWRRSQPAAARRRYLPRGSRARGAAPALRDRLLQPCLEISSAHITEEAGRYLASLADIATPTGFLFVAFRIPYSPAVGVKLIATPWTDENLQRVEGITAERLRQEHRRKGMPESLVEVLHLAALADVRLPVFDADAPVLDGLTLYDDE